MPLVKANHYKDTVSRWGCSLMRSKWQAQRTCIHRQDVQSQTIFCPWGNMKVYYVRAPTPTPTTSKQARQ